MRNEGKVVLVLVEPRLSFCEDHRTQTRWGKLCTHTRHQRSLCDRHVEQNATSTEHLTHRTRNIPSRFDTIAQGEHAWKVSVGRCRN